MHGLNQIQQINAEAVSGSAQNVTAVPHLRAVEPPQRRIISIDVDTGEWIVPVALSGMDGARVAASVLPGTTAELVYETYSKWLCE